MFKNFKFSVIVLLVFKLNLFFVGFLKANQQDVYKQLNLFGEVYERVRSEYVEEIKDKDLIEAAINGMLQSLDPHSSYLNSDSFEEMKVQTKGEFGGLGIEVTMENGLVKVVSPIDETPAAKAGIKSGDYISHIDQEAVMGLTLSEAVDKMRGPVNTPILITVIRKGEEPFDVEIFRDIIKITSVKIKVHDEVGYLRITSFTQKTHKNLIKEFSKLENKMNGNMKGLVLDLRNNPGGLLDQAVSVSDAFLERGEIVSTRGRETDTEQRFNASKGDITKGIPIVVLINGGSASASEIVAGALQDHKRGILLGTSTFGKGSVQTIIPVSSKGAIRLTTARYYTPSGKSIQATGIEPDIFVPQSKLEVLENNNERKESSLRGHLDKKNTEPKENITEEIEKNDENLEEDYQLNRAIDLIKSINVYETLKKGFLMNNSYEFLEKGWRLGVGIVLFNRKKDIFMGERIDNKGAWQMPQGGVDLIKNERLLAAAKRELYEETGARTINYICQSKEWHYYYLPNYLSKKLWKGKFIGQKQKWFAFDFLGNEEEIKIKQENIKQEFCDWKWVSPNEVCDLIINFKKDIYKKVLKEFKHIYA